MRRLTEVAFDQYRHLTAMAPTVAEAEKLCLRFEELVAYPQAAVVAIYDHFGWDKSWPFRKHLQEATHDTATMKASTTMRSPISG